MTGNSAMVASRPESTAFECQLRFSSCAVSGSLLNLSDFWPFFFFLRNYNVSYDVNWEPQSYLDAPGNTEVLGFPRAKH